MTDEQADALLEPILKAAGTSLRHYTLQKSRDDLRAAMRDAVAVVNLHVELSGPIDDATRKRIEQAFDNAVRP